VQTDLTDLSTSVYCERTSPAFWAEPLNASTSLLVIGVALTGFVMLWRRGWLSPSVAVLMALAVLIGLGSFLLHTFATPWAEMVDALAIWSFVVTYGVLALHRFVPERFSLPVTSVLGLGVFGSGVMLASGGFAASVPLVDASVLSASLQYVPAAVVIVGVLGIIWKARHPSLAGIGLGIGAFVVALTFRSLDMPLCGTFPTGTHFLWHMTNCVVCWYLIRTYAAHGKRTALSTAPGAVPALARGIR